MKISGTYTIDAPQQQVWEALNDLDVLARIVPGCERLEQIGENEFEGTIKIGIQSIKGTYQGKIRLEDITPPTHYKLIANGRSANGVVDGVGQVDLAEQDGKTLLTYSGDANIGGTLASVGQRLIEGASRQLINQSLKALTEQIRLRANPPPGEAAPPPAPAVPQNGVSPVEAVAATPAAVIAEAQQAVATGGEVPASVDQSGSIGDTPPRRTVVVPEHEQLKPESIVSGILQDLVREHPWVPWIIIAFLLGYLFGRGRR